MQEKGNKMMRTGGEEGSRYMKQKKRWRIGDDTSENEWRRKEMRGRTGIEGGDERGENQIRGRA